MGSSGSPKAASLEGGHYQNYYQSQDVLLPHLASLLVT